MVYISTNPKVSIIIRTRNVERHLFRLLWDLSCQTLKPSEIIIVDNFSSKKELENLNTMLTVARKRFFDNIVPFKLIPIKDCEFSHPFSTNIGVSATDNELVCITNGHSLPTSIFWLANGIKYFKNVEVAGVSGYFIPHKDGSIWERVAYGLVWSKFNEVMKIYRTDEYFSTINCIIRKSLWKEYPFDESLLEILPETKIFGGEDYDWAQEMIARGYKVIVEPRFNVYHSHGHMFPEIIARNLKWYRIRKKIGSFKRPRKSYSSIFPF